MPLAHQLKAHAPVLHLCTGLYIRLNKQNRQLWHINYHTDTIIYEIVHAYMHDQCIHHVY